MSRQQVLLIDDTDTIHKLVRARLADEPVDVHSAWTADEGLGLALSLAPDVILLDLDIPGDCDGFETCRRLKANHATAGIPIVLLTGVRDPEARMHGLDLGALDYVAKPFDAVELRARVRAALRMKNLTDLLATRAMIDGLTGLWNDAGLQRRLDAELSLSARSGRPLAFVVVDLDGFGKVNQAHGHRFGDEVLKAVARTITNDCRAEDVICRHGADAIAMLRPNSTAEQAFGAAERLRDAVMRIPFTSRTGPVTITCSIGVADNQEDRGALLLDLADRAVQRARKAGGNRTVNGCTLAPTTAAR